MLYVTSVIDELNDLPYCFVSKQVSFDQLSSTSIRLKLIVFWKNKKYSSMTVLRGQQVDIIMWFCYLYIFHFFSIFPAISCLSPNCWCVFQYFHIIFSQKKTDHLQEITYTSMFLVLGVNNQQMIPQKCL